MEQINYDKEEFILNYLYLFSSFIKFIKNSHNLFNNKFLKRNDSFEKIKNDFEDLNFKNETNYIKDETLLSLLPNESAELLEKAKTAKLKTIKDTLSLDLNKNFDEELIFVKISNNIANIGQILNKPLLNQLLLEKIINFIIESNKLFNLIIKMSIQNYKKNELFGKDNEEIEEKNEQIKKENILLKKEIDSLKLLIEKNNKDMDNEKKKLEKKIEKNQNDTIKLIQETQKKIKDNNLETEKIKNESEAKLKESEQKIKEQDLKIKKLEEKMLINKKESEQKIKESEQKIKEKNEKMEEQDLKIKKLEETMVINQKDAEIRYDELNDKYIKLVKINLDNIKIDNEQKKIFDSYLHKIIEANTKNKNLLNEIERLSIELDKIGLENQSLKNYIKLINLEVNEKKNN